MGTAPDGGEADSFYTNETVVLFHYNLHSSRSSNLLVPVVKGPLKVVINQPVSEYIHKSISMLQVQGVK